MEERKVIFKFRNVETEVFSYSINVNTEFDIRTGEYYRGELHIALQGANAMQYATSDFMCSQVAVEGTLEIENQFIDKTIFIENAVMCGGERWVENTFSLQLNFTFKEHRKNSFV